MSHVMNETSKLNAGLLQKTGGTGEKLSNDRAFSVPLVKNSGGTSGTALVTFTLVTSKNADLSKCYWLDGDKTIQKKPNAEMTEGIAERLTIPFLNFQDILNKATSRQAAVYGSHGMEYPEKVKLVVAAKADPNALVLARTKTFYEYRAGAGILMLDHDPSRYGRTMSCDEFMAALIDIHPAMAQAAYIIRRSVSASVCKTGEQPATDGGFHVYIPVSNALDIPRYGKLLFDRLWLKGFGYIALAKNGGKLVRTTIDGAVFSPERLDFICPPILSGEGIDYTPPKIIFQDGGFLDTGTLSDLTEDELLKLNALQDQAKQDIEPQAVVVLNQWKENAIKVQIENGKTRKQAVATIENIIKSKFNHLYGDYILEFASGAVSVAEVLNNPSEYNEKTLADPLEGKSYGATTAKFYWNDGKPLINSMAHGGAKYFLHERPLEKSAKAKQQKSAGQYPASDERPCYRCFDDWWQDDKGNRKKPGVWLFTAKQGFGGAPSQLIDTWICGVISVFAIARDKNNRSFSSILKFKNKLDVWQKLTMPSRLMAGRVDEALKELLDMGLNINYQQRSSIIDFISSQTADKSMWCVDRVGWMDGSFVLPDEAFGENAGDVMLQSDSNHREEYGVSGTLSDWQSNVAKLCVGNAGLMFTLCASFSGALLKPCNIDGFGIHWFGNSSSGKSTGLKMAASVWGDWERYKRSWKTTANGLEGAARLFNDGLLALDEIGDGDAKEISEALYMIFNGTGKQRADVTGQAKNVAKWRVAVLSNGEFSIETHLVKKGLTVQAGQLVRLLQIPVWGDHGAFDELHGSNSGWEFSNRVTQNAKMFYGQAGRAYLKHITASNLEELPQRLQLELEIFINRHDHLSAQETRAAKNFALVGLAGELATDYGITGWNSGAAMQAAIVCFQKWRDYRGVGDVEPQRIKDAVKAYVEKYGDMRFSSTKSRERLHGERSGFWREDDNGKVWLFTKSGLQQATQGMDFKCVLNVLQSEGWLMLDSEGKRTTKVRVAANEDSGTRYYAVRVDDGYAE